MNRNIVRLKYFVINRDMKNEQAFETFVCRLGRYGSEPGKQVLLRASSYSQIVHHKDISIFRISTFAIHYQYLASFLNRKMGAR